MVFVSTILLIQICAYFFLINENWKCGACDAVVVFTGDFNRILYSLDVVKNTGAKLLIISREPRNTIERLVKNKKCLPNVRLDVDDYYSTTTDGNARYAAHSIKGNKCRKVILVTSWYHIPRALMLLKLYLWNYHVQLYVFSSDEKPTMYWMSPELYLEIVKFWGSCGRVILEKFGIDDWPRNRGGLKKLKELQPINPNETGVRVRKADYGGISI
jgi:uncharacterized SAM-binding protein YcdF (DUF218 family)